MTTLQGSSGQQSSHPAPKPRATSYYHVSIGKLQEAFEKQFFDGIIDQSKPIGEVQTDGLTVMVKYVEYTKIKPALMEGYAKLEEANRYMFAAAVLFLFACIWNIIQVKRLSFWLSLVTFETQLFGQEFSLGSQFAFNLMTLLTSLINCLLYFVLGVICRQAVTNKALTTAAYFDHACKYLLVAILLSSGVTLLLGTLLVNSAQCGLATILFSSQVALFLALQVWLILHCKNKAAQLTERLQSFHQFLTSYRQTPRSRAYKKFMFPVDGKQTLDAIMEADSVLEQSVISMP
jgi:hypothetical protein